MNVNKNQFALTPPMGWNSYDYYDTTVNETEVKENAAYMAKHLKNYGYEYVVVDIQWYAYGAGTMRDKYQYIPFGKMEMDEYGRLLPCVERFPSAKNGQGFKPLADYIHSLGLKFGIHIMRGIPRLAAHMHLPVKGTSVTADQIANPGSICDWNSDMYGLRDCDASQAYYDSIVELYARWGVDFIKCDDICNTHAFINKPYDGKHEVEMLHRAIAKCERPIVLSLSPGPALLEQAGHYMEYANMWRISDDFWDNWGLLRRMFDYCRQWEKYVKPGCWPDCDMIPVGKLGRGFADERQTYFTKEEQKTMMTLWCLFRSPLMIGAKLTDMDEDTQHLLTNEKLLKLHREGSYPGLIEMDAEHAVWGIYSEGGALLGIGVFNFLDKERELEVNLPDSWERKIEEIWSGEQIFVESKKLRVQVLGHGVKVFNML